MAIWFKQFALQDVRRSETGTNGAGTMIAHLGIEFTEVGDDYLVATMPVDQRTKQPAGILHGGASVVLAETLASTAGNLVIDHTKEYGVGLEINANHVRSASAGLVTGRTTPLHIGRTTQVWETKITQGENLISICRMTLAVLQRRVGGP